MVTVNIVIKSIRKLMGWCPNAKTFETGSRISPITFEAYDQSGGEKDRNPGISSRFSRLFSRLDIRILLPTIFITPVYINLLFQKGINEKAFLLGFSLSLLIYLLSWKKQMLQYDALVKNPIVGSSSRKTFLWVFLTLILFLILPMIFLSQIPSFLNARSLYSLVAGAWIFMWGSYLQLIYWERKNHMKIYIKNEKGFQKMYAIGEKE
ncbi:DUF1673 family protein [Methanosarcina sp. UBA5]|uniref:DUF1673 family protein n=1 Tax=Methanosarcina sp. UBA5 TaxID=1915593 RepID=UPI003743CFC8